MAKLGRFARTLKKLRVERGYPQRAWGPRLGTHWITAQRWEMGTAHPWPGFDTPAGRRLRCEIEDLILARAAALPPNPKRRTAKGRN